MNKILSIVVPTYNMEKYLERCLGSLIVEAEKMEKLEVLVVNDGSKDRSSEIAHGYESDYPHTFRVIDKENGNYGSCVNRGLAEATGKYVKILDADDWFDTGVFSEYMTFLETVDVDFVFNGMSMVNGDGVITGDYCFESVLGGSPILTMDEYASRMNGVGLYMQNVAYRTECIKQMGYVQTEGISYTDQEWLFAPLFVTKSVAYFPKSLYKYLVGRDGQTVAPEVHMKNMWMEVSVTEKMISDYVRLKPEVMNVQVLRYIQGRVMSRIRFIYVSYLLSASTVLDINQVIRFDKYLASSAPDLYSMSNNIEGKYGIKYVKTWRKTYSFNSLLFFFIRLKKAL